MKITYDTQAKAARLPVGKDELYITVTGTPGLVLRLRKDRKDWLFRYRSRLDGKLKKIALGGYPTIGLADAKRAAEQHAEQLRTGRDPQGERAAVLKETHEEAVRRTIPQTVNELFEDWIQKQLNTRKDGGESVRRAFNRDVLPKLGVLPLHDIRKAHISDVLDAVRARGVNRTVGILLSSLRQMFRFAVARDYLTGDPTASLTKRDFGVIEVERDRVLSEDEIRELSAQLVLSSPQEKLPGDARLKDTTKLAIWIQLATCCRVGELTGAHWNDVDLENGIWRITMEDSKTKRHQQDVFLSPFVLDRFVELARLTRKKGDDKGWCFPDARRGGNFPINPKTVAKQIADRQRADDPMSRRSKNPTALQLQGGKWTPHDLRRTGATLMGELNVSGDVIERILNHTDENRIRRTYQRQRLIEQQRAAWQVLGEKLAEFKNG